MRNLVLAGLLCVAGWAGAQDETVPPFHMPTPEGWRTETIPFPLEFAPELKYEGIEELRFAPGMFAEEAEDFWSYAFVWWLSSEVDIGEKQLVSDLEAYFRGLTRAVAEAREFETGPVQVSVEIQERSESPPSMAGSVVAFDPFVTRKPVSLNLEVVALDCGKHTAWYFRLSPQPRNHAVWRILEDIEEGLRCSPT